MFDLNALTDSIAKAADDARARAGRVDALRSALRLTHGNSAGWDATDVITFAEYLRSGSVPA